MNLKEVYEFLSSDERIEFEFKPMEEFDDWVLENRIIIAHPSIKNKEKAKKSPHPYMYIDLEEKVSFGISYPGWTSIDASFLNILNAQNSKKTKDILQILSGNPDWGFKIYQKGVTRGKSTERTEVYKCACNEIDSNKLGEIVNQIKAYREVWSEDKSVAEHSLCVIQGEVSTDNFRSFDLSSAFNILNNLFSLLSTSQIKKANQTDVRRIKSELRPIEKEITALEEKKAEKEQWIETLIEREAKPEPIEKTKKNIGIIDEELQILCDKRDSLNKKSDLLSP